MFKIVLVPVSIFGDDESLLVTNLVSIDLPAFVP